MTDEDETLQADARAMLDDALRGPHYRDGTGVVLMASRVQHDQSITTVYAANYFERVGLAAVVLELARNLNPELGEAFDQVERIHHLEGMVRGLQEENGLMRDALSKRAGRA